MAHSFKSLYRKEPISTFILTVGVVDAVIGGAGYHWSLLAFGVGLVGAAIAYRWWNSQQKRPEVPSRTPVYYLPDRSSRTQLPDLSVSRKPPRSR